MEAYISQDYIYQCYSDKEAYIDRKVGEKNSLLSSNEKRLISGIIDCIPEDKMYGQPNGDILLTEQQLTQRNRISKPAFVFDDSFYGIYYMPSHNWDIDISRSFSCFINRIDPIRQFFAYKIFLSKLSQDCFLSIRGDNRLGIPSLEYYDRIHQDFYHPQYQDVYQQIRELMPYRNFQETGNLCDTILQSKIHLVIETYNERTDSITYSEKIFRALQTPRPWLLFGSTGSISRLRAMGFYVYDDLVDNSYDDFDTSADSEQRFLAVMDRLEHLTKITITPAMIQHWKSKTLENKELLKQWNQVWKDRVDDVIDQAFSFAKNQQSK